MTLSPENSPVDARDVRYSLVGLSMLACRSTITLTASALMVWFLSFSASATEPQSNEMIQGSVIAAPDKGTTKAKPAQTGIASWYGSSFIGGKTASGERYQPGDRTAAHRTLAFGTYVKITNFKTRKIAVARINNRGPFIKGRIIDLSKQAALDIGLVKMGIARVQVDVIAKDVAVKLAAL